KCKMQTPRRFAGRYITGLNRIADSVRGWGDIAIRPLQAITLAALRLSARQATGPVHGLPPGKQGAPLGRQLIEYRRPAERQHRVFLRTGAAGGSGGSDGLAPDLGLNALRTGLREGPGGLHGDVELECAGVAGRPQLAHERPPEPGVDADGFFI